MNRPLSWILVFVLSSAWLAAAPTFAEEKQAGGKDEVTIRVVDPKQLVEVLKKHRGKVVLIDYWATWCAPCLKQLPYTVDLQHKYKKQGLVVVTMSLDEPDEESAALEVLKQHKANLVNLLCKYGADEKSFNTFGITGGALPHYQLFDRDGKLAQKITAQQPADLLNLHEKVDVAVKELVLNKGNE